MAPRFAFVPARWLAPDSGLAPSDRLNLCVLCQWVNRETGDCWPSVSTIAAHAALSENTIRTAIKNLVSFGAVQVTRRVDKQGDQDSNLYVVIGYDPIPKKGGGTSTIEVPVLQPLQGGTSTNAVEVPQPLNPNVVKDNKPFNGVRKTAGSKEPPPFVGIKDLHGKPMADYTANVAPMSAEQVDEWERVKGQLRGAANA